MNTQEAAIAEAKKRLLNGEIASLEKAQTGSTKHAHWNDLVSLHQTVQDGVVNLVAQIHSVMAQINDAGLRSTDPKYLNLCKTVADDITNFENELGIIRNTYDGKTGYAKTPEDFNLFVWCYERYNALQSLFLGSTQHHMVDFTEIALMLEEERRNKEKAQGEQV